MDTTHTYVQDEQIVLHFTVENIYFFKICYGVVKRTLD